MKRKTIAVFLWVASFFVMSVPCTAGHKSAATLPPGIDDILKEVEQTVTHYRAWLDKPVYTNVIKGTNHAARAVVMIDVYMEDAENLAPGDQRVGVAGIRKVLLKQMRIHTELLSTSVPLGIVAYDSGVEQAVEEQLDLLEQTLKEFERVHRGN